MTNDQRRKQIAALKELISPLDHNKFMTSLRHNYLIKRYDQQWSEEEQAEMNNLAGQLEELNNQLTPLYEQLRGLQVRYQVNYLSEVLEGGILTNVGIQKELFLSTNVDIDLANNKANLNDPDVTELMIEIADYIYSQQFARFEIQGIRRLN